MKADDASDNFGRHVAGAGDVNGDGYPDVIIGAPGNHGRRGAAYVYSGRDGKLLLTLTGEREETRAVHGFAASRDDQSATGEF